MILEKDKLIKASVSQIIFEKAEIINLDQSDFIQPESEEKVTIVRIKDLSVSSEEFYIFSLLQSGVPIEKIPEFVDGTEFLFENVFSDEALIMVKERLESLNHFPESLLPVGKIADAIKLIDDWYYVSVFIKTDQEYYSFFWETTA